MSQKIIYQVQVKLTYRVQVAPPSQPNILSMSYTLHGLPVETSPLTDVPGCAEQLVGSCRKCGLGHYIEEYFEVVEY